MHLKPAGSSLGIFMSTPFSDAVASSVAAVATGSSHGHISSLSAVASSLARSPLAVGVAWMASSSIFTTYTTTTFIKYGGRGSRASNGRSSTCSPQSPSQHRRNGGIIHMTQLRTTRFFATLSQRLPPASLLTMYRFAGSLLFGICLNTDIWSIFQRIRATMSAIPVLALPAAFLFVANFCNSIALDRIGIASTYTTKCAIPLITVLLTLLLDGTESLPKAAALVSLVPIAVGIAAASWNSPTFETIGFSAAVLSATAQSALNVTSKRAMTRAGLTGIAGQRTMAAVGFILAVVFNAIQMMRGSTMSGGSQSRSDKATRHFDGPPIRLTVMAVAAYHIEYVLSFIFVKLVAPITYGTCDALRRLAIILVGRRMFGGDPLTKTNVVGIALALLGALSYSIVSTM